MNSKQLKKQAEYWFLTAKHDYDTMISLFDSKRYSDALFYGHIVLEKILKLLFVASNRRPAPILHDLSILAKGANITLTKNELDLLERVNQFNIRSRYPDFKLNFYKICDQSYTTGYINKITELYKSLCLNPRLKELL